MAVSMAWRFQFLRAETSEFVNDIHSQLNPTRVDRIVKPVNADQLRAAVLDAKRTHKSIAIAGGRHAMGGQQFGAGAFLVDMKVMDQVRRFNREDQTIEIDAGMFWPEFIQAYLERQKGQPN